MEEPLPPFMPPCKARRNSTRLCRSTTDWRSLVPVGHSAAVCRLPDTTECRSRERYGGGPNDEEHANHDERG